MAIPITQSAKCINSTADVYDVIDYDIFVYFNRNQIQLHGV